MSRDSSVSHRSAVADEDLGVMKVLPLQTACRGIVALDPAQTCGQLRKWRRDLPVKCL